MQQDAQGTPSKSAEWNSKMLQQIMKYIFCLSDTQFDPRFLQRRWVDVRKASPPAVVYMFSGGASA